MFKYISVNQSMMRTMRERGISPIVSTLVLLAIALLGGVMVYRTFMATGRTVSTAVQVQVQNASILCTGNNVIISATIKNVGSEAIARATLQIFDGDGDNLDLEFPVGEGLEPGATVSTSCVNPQSDHPELSFTSGMPYAAILRARSHGGGTYEHSFEIYAQ